MKRKRFSVKQIVAVLKQAEAGDAGSGVDASRGHFGANLLSPEERVRRFAERRGAAAQAASGRERATEEGGHRADVGQGAADRRIGKKW